MTDSLPTIYWTYFLPGVALLSILAWYAVFYSWYPDRWPSLKIQSRVPGKVFLRRERLYTAYALLVFLMVGALTDWMRDQGWTKLYAQWDRWTYGYLIGSVGGVLLVQDAYFYWSHRLLHWRPLYRHVHSWHHRFHNPTPWSAFAFHPVEGLIQIGFVPLLALLPIHQAVLIGYTAFVLIGSVYGHTGYELRANKSGIWTLFNTSIHHNQHHTSYRYNFGIFLNLWDRWMGTHHPDYEAEVERMRPDGQEKGPID